MKFKAQFSEKSRRTVCTHIQSNTWANLPGHCCPGNSLWSRQAVPCSSGLRFSSKLGEGARGQFLFCCFLFMDITSSALQVLKMFLFFWDGISKHCCIFFSVSPLMLSCRRRAGDKIKWNAEVFLSNFFAKMEVMESVVLLRFLSLPC